MALEDLSLRCVAQGTHEGRVAGQAPVAMVAIALNRRSQHCGRWPRKRRLGTYNFNDPHAFYKCFSSSRLDFFTTSVVLLKYFES